MSHYVRCIHYGRPVTCLSCGPDNEREILRRTVLGVVVVGGTSWPSQPLSGYAHAMTLSYLTCSRIVSACIPALVRPPCITMPLTARTHPAPPSALISAFLLCALPTKFRDTCSQSSTRRLLEQSSRCLAFCDRPHDS